MAGLTLLGLWSDSMISRTFSNLNEPMILSALVSGTRIIRDNCTGFCKDLFSFKAYVNTVHKIEVINRQNIWEVV